MIQVRRRHRLPVSGQNRSELGLSWRTLVGVAALAVALLATAQAQADAVSDFYKGKQVNLVVGYGTGGGYDVYARLIARYLRAHPGSLDSWRGICSKSPEHDADHGEADECSNGRCVAFEVASQATVTTDPRERSFDDPPFG